MGLRLYRLLLRLLPPGLRERIGPDMVALVRAMRREGRAGPVFWTRLLWDTTTQAAAAWWGVVRHTVTTMTNRGVEDTMTTLVHDVRYALRRIRRQPMFSLTVMLLVAVGIAGNTAVFRMVHGLFLRPLPFPEAHRLVDLNETAPEWDLEYVGIAIPDFRAWQGGNETFEAMVALNQSGANLELDGEAVRVDYLATTHDVDEVFGLEPLLGRFYTPEEDRDGVSPVALLSRDFWVGRFGADPAAVGRSVRMNGETVEIIGVLPDEAAALGDVDLWLPLREDDASSYYLRGVGRLRQDVTVERARADLLAAHRALADERPSNEVTSPTVERLRDRYVGDYRLGSGLLLAAVGAILLLACGNIAAMMVARSVSRTGEISVRRALGARSGRIVRQLLTESLLLAGIGAAAGAALGVWGSGVLLELQADGFPGWVSFELDATFVAFSALLTVGAAVLFGLAPALRASSSPASPQATGRSTASRGSRRVLSLLVGVEVAAAAALLVVAGLAVQDARALARVDPGFDPQDLLTYRLELDETRYPDFPERRAFGERYLERIRAIPGVEAAVLSSNLPLTGHSGWFYEVEGYEREEDETQAHPVTLRRWVSPGYFEAMGVTLVQGRPFDAFDGRGEDDLVTVVNETFVRTHVPPGVDPLGLRVYTGSERQFTVVGVVRDVRHYGLDEPMRPGTYEPIAQNPASSVQVALRAPGDPLAVVPAARAATAELDPALPLYDVQAMSQRLDASLLNRRATTWLLAGFSAVALFLAVAGLYGVISYTVGQRTGEISVRMAMGAPARTESARVVRQGMTIVVLGLAPGLAVAFLGAGALSGVLVGVAATEPLVYAGVAALVLAVGALANWIPARRAAALDPMRALRGE